MTFWNKIKAETRKFCGRLYGRNSSASTARSDQVTFELEPVLDPKPTEVVNYQYPLGWEKLVALLNKAGVQTKFIDCGIIVDEYPSGAAFLKLKINLGAGSGKDEVIRLLQEERTRTDDFWAKER